MAAALAIAIVVVTLLVAGRSATEQAQSGIYLSVVPQPLLVILFLSIPAWIAGIACVRRSPVMLVIAGVNALLQSFVAFSGATLGFLVPGFMLIYLGVREGDSSSTARPIGRQMLAGVAVLILVASAWVLALTATETVCWGDTASSGCVTGIPTNAGILGSTILIIGALAVAWIGSAAQAEGRSRM